VKLIEFNRILRQVLILPVLALLLLAAALYLEIRGSNDTVKRIQRLDERINQATLLSKLIVDEESGLRGYQATSDARFLEPYRKAHSEFEDQFVALESVPGANKDETGHLQHLRETHQAWHDAFATPLIKTIEAGGKTNDPGLDLQGQILMDNVRSDLDAVIRETQIRRSRRFDYWRLQTQSLVLGLFVLAIAMGVGIGLFTRSRLNDVSSAYRDSLEMLQHRAEDIFDSEQQLRTTLASIGDGVITCDVGGRIEMMNPVAQELTGWREDEAIGKPLESVFQIIHETTRKSAENPIAKVKRLKKIVGLANHTVLIRKDGTELHVADSGAPIRDKTGEIAGVVLVFRDVTLERRTQDALLANEKLVVAGRLAATIAHEIHNPLDSVSNLLYLMRHGATEEESKQFMAMAEQELARVTQISRAMLGLYRESKTPVQADLREMLLEILLLMERRINELGVTVHTDLPETISVDGFPAELRQVFTNLIANAAEAAGRGGEVRISITPQVAAGSGQTGVQVEAGATVKIADNGPGIPDEIQAQMFQPFFTTKGHNGTGLGLWVSRGIVNKHGGRISIESDTTESAHGTVVSVFLATKPVMQLGGN
jgi:PAS domain S-box-containing protein